MNKDNVEKAMDLLTIGGKKHDEVLVLLGEETVLAAERCLDNLYGGDHIPWYAKKWDNHLKSLPEGFTHQGWGFTYFEEL